jgi:hypothetical protein
MNRSTCSRKLRRQEYFRWEKGSEYGITSVNGYTLTSQFDTKGFEKAVQYNENEAITCRDQPCRSVVVLCPMPPNPLLLLL